MGLLDSIQAASAGAIPGGGHSARRGLAGPVRAALGALLLAGLLTPLAAAARGPIFMFVDERGVTHFTNDPRGDQRFQQVALAERGPRIVHPTPPRSTVYDDLIDRTAQDHRVPPALLKAVIAAESAFDYRAVSHRGAQGLMQLMPSTAAQLGVEDPFEPAENVRGGASYLREMIDRYGDLSRALAAYNAGPSAVDRYGGVPPFRETRAYVERVLTYYRRYHGDFAR